MADIVKTPEDVLRSGLAATYFAPTTTDTYVIENGGDVVIHAKKTGAGICTVTFVTPGTVDGLAVADRTATVPATTGDRFFGPFQRDTYNTDGSLRVTFSEVTGLTVAVLRVRF